VINSAVGFICQGHGVASGKKPDSRFPNGTIALQYPLFAERGLDLSLYFKGTVNISFSRYLFVLGEPKYYFPGVKWCDEMPAENFSFFSCFLKLPEQQRIDAFVYWPHPSTKPSFHQDPSVLEFLAPWMDGINYGQQIEVFAETGSINFLLKSICKSKDK